MPPRRGQEVGDSPLTRAPQGTGGPGWERRESARQCLDPDVGSVTAGVQRMRQGAGGSGALTSLR